MFGERFNFDMKFQLIVVFGLSLSLATPIIQGLGYTAPGFFARTFYTGLFLISYTLIHLYPFLAVIFPVFLLSLTAIYLWNAPLILERLTLILSMPQPADAIFWPMVTIALITLTLYILVFRLNKPVLLLFLIGLITFVPLWYLYVNSAYPAVITYSAFWLMFLSYKRGTNFWIKLPQNDEDHCTSAEIKRGWITYTVVILSIVMLITLLLPKNFAPVPWHSIQNWAADNLYFLRRLRTVETADSRGTGEEFNFYSFGLQESADLGGPFWQDNTILLEVIGRGGIYLKGSVQDLYTGKNWVNTGTFTELDSFPPPPESLLDSLAKTNLTIRHNRLRTRSLFVMLYPQKITSLPGNLLIDQNSGMALSRSIPLNNEYYLEGYYLAYRVDIPRLEQDEDLSKMEPFLRLPADLPSRVEQLALEITGDQEGYYNKLKALETYLRLNYSYNTEIPFLPNDRDFVDFFLFDLREGYCTSFASALAVMGRAAGIPTRYVVGFAVPNIPSENGIYQVAGSNAHAWVEGYIPGVGWLTFEATSTFRTADALPIRREAVDHYIASAGNTDRRTGSINNREISDIDSDYLAYNNEISTAAFFAGLLKILTAAILVTLFSVTVSILDRFRQIKTIIKDLDNQNNKLRAVGYYNLALSLLERIALAKYPGETPREYSRRIIRDVHNWTLNFREISEGINLALYSKHKISSDLAEQTALFFHYIFDCYLARVGKITALIEILYRGRYFINRAPSN